MRLHPVRTVLLLVVGVVIVVAAWVAWTAWNVVQDLDAAVDDARALETSAKAGDEAGIDAALDSLREDSKSAADGTGSWAWSILTVVPAFGDDAEGVRTVSEVVSELSSGGLGDLATAARDLDSLTPRDGRISIDALRDLQGPVARGGSALDQASVRLAEEDPASYVARLRDSYRELTNKVGDASRALRSADTALRVLPSMLGDGERRRYVLLLQNNAEVRATGGNPGSLSMLEVEDGQISLTRQASTGTFGEAPQATVQLTPAEKELYGPAFARFMQDVTFTQDFPRTAELVQARWEQVFPEDDIDGVLSMDVVTASYLLDVTGPITVDGVELTSANAVDELLSGVYLRSTDTNVQDAFFATTAKTMFDRVSAGVGEPTALFQTLARASDEGRLYVHSFRPEEQGDLAGREIAGEMTKTASDRPAIDVTLNDTTGSKMSYYLRSEVRVTSTSCVQDQQRLTGSAELSSLAPADAASLPTYVTGAGEYGIPAGDQLVTVRVFGPVGGSVSKARLDYKKTEVNLTEQDGRPVATFYVLLEPGKTVAIDWQMETGAEQSGDADVRVTPGVTGEKASSTVDSSCS